MSQKKFATIFKKALIYAIFENIISIVIGHQPFNGVQLQPLINYLYSPHRSPPVPLSGYLTFYIKSNFSIILLTIRIPTALVRVPENNVREAAGSKSDRYLAEGTYA